MSEVPTEDKERVIEEKIAETQQDDKDNEWLVILFTLLALVVGSGSLFFARAKLKQFLLKLRGSLFKRDGHPRNDPGFSGEWPSASSGEISLQELNIPSSSTQVVQPISPRVRDILNDQHLDVMYAFRNGLAYSSGLHGTTDIFLELSDVLRSATNLSSLLEGEYLPGVTLRPESVYQLEHELEISVLQKTLTIEKLKNDIALERLRSELETVKLKTDAQAQEEINSLAIREQRLKAETAEFSKNKEEALTKLAQMDADTYQLRQDQAKNMNDRLLELRKTEVEQQPQMLERFAHTGITSAASITGGYLMGRVMRGPKMSAFSAGVQGASNSGISDISRVRANSGSVLSGSRASVAASVPVNPVTPSVTSGSRPGTNVFTIKDLGSARLHSPLPFSPAG